MDAEPVEWPEERYVRVYVRDTDEWLLLSWEARALWLFMLRKFDRAGILTAKLGARSLAAYTGMPLVTVEVSLAELIADGCVKEFDGGFVAPNYIEAQEAKASDPQRARESRGRRRDIATSQGVMFTSRNVTDGHDANENVTPSLAVPSRTDLERGNGAAPLPPEPLGSRKRKPGKIPARPLSPEWRPPAPYDAQEFEKFTDHHEAKGSVFASWDAAWRTWTRNAQRWADERSPIVRDRKPALRVVPDLPLDPARHDPTPKQLAAARLGPGLPADFVDDGRPITDYVKPWPGER